LKSIYNGESGDVFLTEINNIQIAVKQILKDDWKRATVKMIEINLSRYQIINLLVFIFMLIISFSSKEVLGLRGIL
jgi:hypothetical protein